MKITPGKMVIEWKECENEGIDSLALDNPNCLNALRNCGLLKFLSHRAFGLNLSYYNTLLVCGTLDGKYL